MQSYHQRAADFSHELKGYLLPKITLAQQGFVLSEADNAIYHVEGFLAAAVDFSGFCVKQKR